MPGKHNKPMKMHGKPMAHHGKKPAKMHKKKMVVPMDAHGKKPMDGHGKKPMKYNKPMDGHKKKPAKINAAVGLHGPFKMKPGSHSQVNPGNFKGSEVAKYSAMAMHPMKYHDKPASAGLKKLAAANPDKLKYIGPEKYGPHKYHGPNMADYPREDYTEKASGTFTENKDEEKKDNGNGNGNGNGEKKSTAASNLSAARKRRKAARQQLKADRLNRRASRMEARRR